MAFQDKDHYERESSHHCMAGKGTKENVMNKTSQTHSMLSIPL